MQTEEHEPAPAAQPMAEPVSEGVPVDLGRRTAAAFVDLCVVASLFFGVGWLGSWSWLGFINDLWLFWLVPIAYALLRDTYIGKSPLSLGKRLAGIDLITEKGSRPDVVTSLQRNLMFFFPPLALCAAAVELFVIARSDEHLRFGDYFGKTRPVMRAVA